MDFFLVVFSQISVYINYVNPAFASRIGSGQTEERVENIQQPQGSSCVEMTLWMRAGPWGK